MRIRILTVLGALVLFLAGLLSPEAQARDEDREWFATIYVGQWTSSKLGEIPLRAPRGRLDYKSSYLVSGALSYVAVPHVSVDLPLVAPIVEGTSLEFEALFGRHFGQQDHAEVALSVFWRSRDLHLPGGGAVNFAVGEGLSLALSPPALEGTRRDVRSNELQNYLAFEAEFSHEAMPGISFVPRIHHRSGIFGIIAPRHTGSNIIGAGLRVTLQ